MLGDFPTAELNETDHKIFGRRVHVVEWGLRTNPAVVLFHGFSRTSRDFDELAGRLARNYFVICPDAPGRGRSEWSDDPENEYRLARFAELTQAVLEYYGIDKTHWIGTSMGGVVGLLLAAMPGGPEIKTLVLNDVGPGIAAAGKQRISGANAELPKFATLAEAKDWFRANYAVGGTPTEAYFERTFDAQMTQDALGAWMPGYDPAINLMLTTRVEELDCWSEWEMVSAPTMVFWGQKSDVLTEDMVARMKATRPKTEIVDFPDLGHAPNLSNPQRIELIAGFLARHS